MQNRKTRREQKSICRRELKKANWFDNLEDRTDGYIAKIRNSGKSPENFRYFGFNKLLSITIMEFPSIYLMGFRNNNQDKDVPWHVKETWKTMFKYDDKYIFGDLWGFECFPPNDCVIDEANMYWLMIPKESMSTSDIDMRNFKFFPIMEEYHEEA
jgi:hypothetical protein